MNRKKIALWAGAGVALLLVSRAVFGARALAKGGKILLIGDSLGVGLSAPLKALAASNGYAFNANAVTGSRTDQWDPKLGPILATEAPGLVFVSLGTNDGAMSDPIAQDAHFASIAKQIKDSGARLIWIAPPAMPARLSMAPVRDMIWRYSPEVIDSAAMHFERAPDGIHSTPSGYADWAAQLWSAATQLGAVA